MRSLSVFFGVTLLSLTFAPAVQAGGFLNPFQNEAICGSMAVTATMAATTSYMTSTHCKSMCRAASAQCHAFVVRVASCDTAFMVDNAAFQVRSCNELIADPVTRMACRVSVRDNLIAARTTIVSDRDSAFSDCDSWELACQASCPVP